MHLQPDPRFFKQLQPLNRRSMQIRPLLNNRYPPPNTMSFVPIQPHQLREIAPFPHRFSMNPSKDLPVSPSRDPSQVLQDARSNLKRMGKRLESPPKKVRFAPESKCLGPSITHGKEGGGPVLSEDILKCLQGLEETISQNERKIV